MPGSQLNVPLGGGYLLWGLAFTWRTSFENLLSTFCIVHVFLYLWASCPPARSIFTGAAAAGRKPLGLGHLGLSQAACMIRSLRLASPGLPRNHCPWHWQGWATRPSMQKARCQGSSPVYVYLLPCLLQDFDSLQLSEKLLPDKLHSNPSNSECGDDDSIP